VIGSIVDGYHVTKRKKTKRKRRRNVVILVPFKQRRNGSSTTPQRHAKLKRALQVAWLAVLISPIPPIP
jgi:hypothetical protein